MKYSFVRSITYFLIYICLYSILPILFLKFPEVSGYYEVILDLWVFNPLFSILVSALICRKYGFLTYVPIICGLSNFIVLILFYDQTRFVFLIVDVVLSLIGCFIGQKLYESRINEIY